MDNSEKKLAEILQRLEKIEKILNPPLYKKISSWCVQHFLLILVISILTYFSWKTWLLIDHLQTSFDALKASIIENTDSFEKELTGFLEKLEPLRFWK